MYIVLSVVLAGHHKAHERTSIWHWLEKYWIGEYSDESIVIICNESFPHLCVHSIIVDKYRLLWLNCVTMGAMHSFGLTVRSTKKRFSYRTSSIVRFSQVSRNQQKVIPLLGMIHSFNYIWTYKLRYIPYFFSTFAWARDILAKKAEIKSRMN